MSFHGSFGKLKFSLTNACMVLQYFSISNDGTFCISINIYQYVHSELLSYFQAEVPMHCPSFSFLFSLTIKDKTIISLTFKILHIRQGSFTRKVRTIFTLKIIVNYVCETLYDISFTLAKFFYRKSFCEKGCRCL